MVKRLHDPSRFTIVQKKSRGEEGPPQPAAFGPYVPEFQPGFCTPHGSVRSLEPMRESRFHRIRRRPAQTRSNLS
jgi:hypothetical protein